MNIVRWCDRFIKYSFYLLFILVPLILTPWNYELFEFNKMILTYGLTVIIMTAWFLKMASMKKIEIKKTPLDIPIILFVLSQLISSIFSMDPHVSWFGYYSRFNGGMISVFCYVFLYYAFVSNWRLGSHETEKHEKNKSTQVVFSIPPLLYVMLGSGVLVSVYGILERLGIDKNLWVQDVQNRVFSTLGQPNWLAAYLVALLPIALAFAMRPFIDTKKKSQQKFTLYTVIFAAVYVLFFVTLQFTKSRSGMLGYGAAVALFSLVCLIKKSSWRKAITPFIILHVVILGFASYFGTNIEQIDKFIKMDSIVHRFSSQPTAQTTAPTAAQTGTLLEYGGTESGTIRQYVWQAAITAWRATSKTFFIGTGTETFAFAFFQYKPVGHNLTSEWDFLYNKAHNEYLNYLATTGLVGLLTYLSFIGLFAVWYTKSKIVTPIDQEEEGSSFTLLLSLALVSGWVSILVTNFFGFSVVIIQLFFFLFPAIVLAMLRTNDDMRFSLALKAKAVTAVTAITIFIGIIAFGYVVIMWVGDYFFALGYRQSQAGKLVDSYKNLTQATFFRPREPMYLDQFGVVLGSLSLASLEAGNATAASELAQQSLAANNLALAISPNNVNFWKTRTKIYFGFSSLDSKFVDAAKESLQKAYSLSPNDPKITYNLAVLEGRLGNNDNAIEILKKTIDLKPNYRDAYYALSVFYQETKKTDLAKKTLQDYLTKVDPNDKDFQDKLKAE